MNGFADPRGSMWRRWDPHLHTPGTALNDQFRGEGAWERWFSAVESANPHIEVLGVTDYWSLDNYETVRREHAGGRLKNVRLLFPNVELRLSTGTLKGRAINAHLLVSPEKPDHLLQARRFLGSLTFRYRDEMYRCTREDLIMLGRAHDPEASSDERAHEVGATQFKVGFDELRKTIEQSAWARESVLLAVAAGKNDGTSGLPRDGTFDAFRSDLERSSNVIFSSNPTDRSFWLGEGGPSDEEIIAAYGSLKVCLHGSDAHKFQDVGAPDLERCQWIKGDATFEALRQACIEPSTRAWIGDTPPSGALAYRTITEVRLDGAPWARDASIPLNAGLVGIIGARGSGKTALADLVAASAGCDDHLTNESSFLHRAAEHLTSLSVELSWGDGETSEGPSHELAEQHAVAEAQYLSQQFVERLCSADGGLSKELIAEIERVIYAEHSPETRAGTASFAELRQGRTEMSRVEQQRSAEAIATVASELNVEHGKRVELEALEKRRAVDAGRIEQNRKARSTLTVTGGEERAKRLVLLTNAVEARQTRLDALERQRISLEALAVEVAGFRSRGVRREADRLRTIHGEAGLSEDDWNAFALQFIGDVDGVLARRLSEVSRSREILIGIDDGSKELPAIGGAELEKVSLAVLRREITRLETEIGLDRRKQAQLSKLNTDIANAEVALARLDERIADAKGAADRIEELRTRWHDEYRKMFAAIQAREDALRALYEPLATAIAAEKGLIESLSFVVRRDVDVAAWAAEAEDDLLDLRKSGPFRGRGGLEELANALLRPAWSEGAPDEVEAAMKAFRDAHDRDLAAHSPGSWEDRAGYYAWGAKVSRWLASTDHIKVRYGIRYEGVDIERLSPGTRGIVLLLLYLAIDRNDDRPLIIDQPEENLDPKSIFDELVDRFRSVRERRQVIIVTHNANLVVNTDVDQVIVATASPRKPGELPDISWTSGALENPAIRKDVCGILEGGERAFRERARRLRVATN